MSNTPLGPGSKLGPYEVVAPLGAGGMGEVYRARDTRLRRDVALKVLPPSVSSDPQRRTRFEQEALAAAALNHPNILGVYDVGDAGNISYIATELVVGETLAAVIERGAVPVRTLLDVAVQIADGMSTAHAAGIVHRDIKPANVMITADGRVKILDFGLAKQSARAAARGDETILVDQTEPGMIVGTVNYMSPEQARGQQADYRADQFSFGLVLYEMATGRQPFARTESVQTMAAIISEEPPPIDAKLPAPLRWIIDRCLAKEPSGRYESSRDLFRELRSLREHLSEVSTVAAAAVAPAARPATSFGALPAIVGLVLGVAITLGALALRSGPALPDQSAFRFRPFSFEPGGQAWPTWSPDGRAVAYSARQQPTDPYQVFLRYLESATPLQLTRLPSSAYPVGWSADGKRVLLMTAGADVALWSIATVGGEPEPFMALPKELQTSRAPTAIAVSPDNKTVAAFVTPPDGVAQVVISSPPGSPPKKYLPDPFAAKVVYNRPRLRFSPDGSKLLLIRNSGEAGEEAWLLPYPPGGSGSVKRVLAGLRSYGGTPAFSWMPDSRRLVLSLQPTPDTRQQLWMADIDSGEQHVVTSGTTAISGPVVSPDGQRVIFSEGTGNYDVVSVDLATAKGRRLIASARDELMPAWAAADPSLVYVSDRDGVHAIWTRRRDDTDRPVVTAAHFADGATQWFVAPTLSPRGDRVVYARVKAGATARLWISAIAGGEPVPMTNENVSEFPGCWSADGAWFAYSALRDGRRHLMKVKTTGQATPAVLRESVSGGGVPSCSPTGEWIALGDTLISADGKQSRPLGKHNSPYYEFSKDGKLVYGLRRDRERVLLYSIDIATGAERVIGDVGTEFEPGSNLSPSIRYSLSPDGTSIVYGSGTFSDNLWMLEGFAPR